MQSNVGSIKDFLLSAGFSISPVAARAKENKVNWQATRKSQLQARECAANGPRCILIVDIYSMDVNGALYESAEVALKGEVDGVWWSLSAYAISFDRLKSNIETIEAHLVRAWNAL